MNGMNHLMKRGMLTGYASSKGVPAPGFAVVFSGLLILLGGLGIFLGVLIPWAIASLVLFLVSVSFKMHAFWKISDPNMKMMEMVNFTKNMALLGAALMLAAVPEPWSYSLF